MAILFRSGLSLCKGGGCKMINFRQKRKIEKIAYSKVSIFILFVLVVLLSIATFNIYKKYKITKDNRDRTESSLRALEKREEVLSSEIKRLGTEFGFEEEIRKRYNAVKEGEQVIVIVDNESDSEKDTKNASGISGLWQKFLDVFR